MRTSLLPGLLEAVNKASRRGENEARLFTVGAIFAPSTDAAGLPDEIPNFAAVLAGARRVYLGKPEPFDVYDAKGVALEIIERVTGCGASVALQSAERRAPHLHPRGAADVFVEPARVRASRRSRGCPPRRATSRSWCTMTSPPVRSNGSFAKPRAIFANRSKSSTFFGGRPYRRTTVRSPFMSSTAIRARPALRPKPVHSRTRRSISVTQPSWPRPGRTWGPRCADNAFTLVCRIGTRAPISLGTRIAATKLWPPARWYRRIRMRSRPSHLRRMASLSWCKSPDVRR